MRASAWTPCDCGADQCRVRRLEGDDVDDPAASVSLTDGAWLWRMRRADRRFEWGTVDLEAGGGAALAECDVRLRQDGVELLPPVIGADVRPGCA